MNINKTKLVTPLAALALMLSAAGGYVAEAHADTTDAATTTSTSVATQPTDQGPGSGMDGGTHAKPAAIGKVTAVNGDTITLTDSQSGTTYTVDATTATIMKQLSSSSTDQTDTKPTAPTTATVSDIVVGDTLMVQGTVSGTTITATRIDDGMPHGGQGGNMGGGFGGGHGGPGVTGTVTAVNGTTLTITGKDGTTYTVDGSSATATKMETITVPSIAVGDTVGIDGTVSGTSVTAKHIMDGMPQMQSSDGAATSTTAS